MIARSMMIISCVCLQSATSVPAALAQEISREAPSAESGTIDAEANVGTDADTVWMPANEAMQDLTLDSAMADAEANMEATADDAADAAERAFEEVADREFERSWHTIVTSSSDAKWQLRGRDWFSADGVSKPKWVKIDHSKDRSVEHRTTMLLYRFDCTNSKNQLLSYATYFRDGRISDSHEFGYPKWKYAIPETMVERVMGWVCST